MLPCVAMNGERLKEIRERLGLTQDELAELIGLKGKYRRNTVTRWEMGQMAIREPTARLIEIIAKQRKPKKGGRKK